MWQVRLKTISLWQWILSHWKKFQPQTNYICIKPLWCIKSINNEGISKLQFKPIKDQQDKHFKPFLLGLHPILWSVTRKFMEGRNDWNWCRNEEIQACNTGMLIHGGLDILLYFWMFCHWLPNSIQSEMGYPFLYFSIP